MSWNRRAPSATGPLVAPTTSGVSGLASKFGDQGDCAPSTHSDPIITTAVTTIPTDHGRREGARSPRFDRKGTLMSRAPAMSGAPRMT